MPLIKHLPVLAVLALLPACGSDESEAQPRGVPESWLETTAKEWPRSDGFDSSMPVLKKGTCATYDGTVKIAGARPEVTDVGYGPFGGGDRKTGYRYVCNLWDRDHYAGDLQVLKVPDRETADRVIAETMDATDTPVQTNDVSTVTSRGLDVHVLRRWYPTNPQGEYQALVFDERQLAFAVLTVNSLDKDDFEAYTEDDVAADLAAVLAAA